MELEISIKFSNPYDHGTPITMAEKIDLIVGSTVDLLCIYYQLKDHLHSHDDNTLSILNQCDIHD